jgi:hypothetical protein
MMGFHLTWRVALVLVMASLPARSADWRLKKDNRSREEILEDAIAEGLRMQHQFRPEPLYKTTGKGSYQSQTVKEIAAAKKKWLPK